MLSLGVFPEFLVIVGHQLGHVLAQVPVGSGVGRNIHLVQGKFGVAFRAPHILATCHRHGAALAGECPGIVEAELEVAVRAFDHLRACESLLGYLMLLKVPG